MLHPQSASFPSLPCVSPSLTEGLRSVSGFFDPRRLGSRASSSCHPGAVHEERTTEARPSKEDVGGWVECVGLSHRSPRRKKETHFSRDCSSPCGWATPDDPKSGHITQAQANVFSLLRWGLGGEVQLGDFFTCLELYRG